ncbi:hypothetical protein BRE01_42840 [Brevibacillus reuszeri]|uniref:Lipoprotein n=1 Tax=Brevibacillus reuszeri TaxID=54915 RepID=A0A0K9YUV5_9BACL|nr:hypothetical protein [Brevibacillus reuszeri]KNB72432.1 hypothetical protein ADS79_11190 [Brevibacillus reuszeri]MED1860903.1 hypothetical protein [Brevibacillus reuszeri]GED70582.1 hypothetical protein BRE01_42840 [Brevibacillus reuszeri]
MNSRKTYRFLAIFVAVILMLVACSAQNEGAGSFDPENQKEYGINGIYLGQNIKEAMDLLKPSKADFMDMVTRESYTVDQMATGAGEAVMGMLLVNRTQVIVKVKKGELQSIMLGGVAKEDAEMLKTYRGLAMYDSVEKMKKLYGEATGEKEVVYKGSKYMANFGITDNKVVWFRFDQL